MRLKINFICIVLLSVASSCTRLEPRKPLNEKKTSFLDASVIRNKRQYDLEQQLFKTVMKRDSTLTYQSSQYGFWYAFKTQSTTENPLPQKGDRVLFDYEIADLNGILLYGKEELGQITYYVDEEELLPALREGIRIMRPGEEVVFLFPSYLCFGYLGDGEKITINQPLRFTIFLVSLARGK